MTKGKIWNDANAHFEEVQHLAKKDENGNICGIWGAMSDFSHSFMPWEDFNKGLYLAGVECNDDVFSKVMEFMKSNGISLVGAVHDFTCPKTGKNYMYFPIGRNDEED